MIEWSELPDKVGANPITLKDGLVWSHTNDGGLTFIFSKFGDMQELVDFLNSEIEAIGGGGTGFTMPMFSSGGEEIQDSPMTVTESGPAVVDDGLGIGVSANGFISLNIKGETDDNTKIAINVVDINDVLILKLLNDGLISLKNGTGVNEFSTDGTLAGDSDDAVPTEKAVKTYVDAQSGGGWLGSETRIKIAPWDIVSYNDKDGVSIQDDGGVVNDAAAKITTMVTGVFIPTGYKATAFMINASANIAIELFESQIDDSTAVSRGSGNANTEVNITNVNSTITNYLSIIIVEAGNDIQGGYVVIQEI